MLRMLAPATLPRVDEIGCAPITLLFTLGLAVIMGLLLALVLLLRFRTFGIIRCAPPRIELVLEFSF